MKQYKALEKGESRQARLINSIEHTRKQAISKDDFIQKMDKLGYEVQWSDKRARVTYIDKEYQALDTQRKQAGEKGVKYKFSEKSLMKYGISKDTLSKEGLLHEFSRNDEKQRTEGIKRRAERKLTWGDRGNSRTSRIPESKPNSIDRQDAHNPRREQDRQTDISQGTRKESERIKGISRQSEPSIQGNRATDERPQSNKPTRNTKELQRDLRGQKEERGNSQGNDKTDKGLGISTKTDSKSQLEGKGETIRNPIASNNRIDSGISRSIPTGEPFSEILKSLSNAIKKADSIEKAKVEQQQKTLEKQKQMEKATPARSMDYDREM